MVVQARRLMVERGTHARSSSYGGGTGAGVGPDERYGRAERNVRERPSRA